MRQVRLVFVGVVVVLIAALTARAQFVQGIEQVVFSVKDLARSEEVYTSAMGFRVRERGEGGSISLQRLWNLPSGIEMKWALLEKSEAPTSTQIRLVQFTPQSPRLRYVYRYQDGGYADIHFCVPDVVAAYTILAQKGFTFLHEPALWRGGAGRAGELGTGSQGWYEVFMQGPDGEGITLIPGNLFGCPNLSGPGSFSPIRSLMVSVTNLDKAYAFYQGILGWNEGIKDADWGLVRRYEAFGPDMDRMLRLPTGTVARAIFFAGKTSTPYLCLTEFAGASKINLYARNAPPYRGFIISSYKASDIERLYQRLVAANVEIVMPPIEISDRPYGGARAFSVRGPDGAFIEFIERKGQ